MTNEQHVIILNVKTTASRHRYITTFTDRYGVSKYTSHAQDYSDLVVIDELNWEFANAAYNPRFTFGTDHHERAIFYDARIRDKTSETAFIVMCHWFSAAAKKVIGLADAKDMFSKGRHRGFGFDLMEAGNIVATLKLSLFQQKQTLTVFDEKRTPVAVLLSSVNLARRRIGKFTHWGGDA